jgi:hypothetical protein
LDGCNENWRSLRLALDRTFLRRRKTGFSTSTDSIVAGRTLTSSVNECLANLGSAGFAKHSAPTPAALAANAYITQPQLVKRSRYLKPSKNV